jgi:TolB-like protein/DNA-binding winged helix-turn-helix (wHTH) protein
VADDFRVGAWLIEPRLNTVSRNGESVHLEPKVMEVLVCLAQHAGEPVPKDELLQAVWPDTFVTDDVLKRSISELRRVFEDDARESRIIQTIPKRGYRLIAPVEPLNGSESASPAPAGPQTSRPLRRWWALALLSGLATLVLIALTFSGHSFRLGKNPAPPIRSIAVLPLENLSGDPAQEYLSDGMTDALITDLAQLGSLKVISRTSSTQYKKTRKSLPEITRELSVDGVIEGAVQRFGDRVRITARLIEGGSERHLWASSYERDLRDVFALEREVAEDIVRQVQGKLKVPSQLHPPQPQATNPGALDAYLQGSYHLNLYGKGSGKHELKKAAEYFHLAIDTDPKFVPAYIGTARAHYDLPVSSHEDWEIRRKAAERALMLDPNSSEAVGILAKLRWEMDFDWSGAEKEYRQAIALNPNDAEVRQDFCTLLAEMGRTDEAWRECQIAQELDPGNAHLPFISYWRGEYDRAIAMLRIMIERHPDDGGMHYLFFQCYTQKASHKDSIEELRKMVTLFGDMKAADKIHRAFEMSGYQAALREWANQLEHFQATRKYFLPVNLADIYAILGERDRAFSWLEQAFKYREQVSLGEPVDYAMVNPMLDSLRSDPRFKDLRRRIGLP